MTDKETKARMIRLPEFLSGGSDGKESTCNVGDLVMFNPWLRKIPWRKERLPTPVSLPGELHGQRSLAGYIVHGVTKESGMIELKLSFPLCFLAI